MVLMEMMERMEPQDLLALQAQEDPVESLADPEPQA